MTAFGIFVALDLGVLLVSSTLAVVLYRRVQRIPAQRVGLAHAPPSPPSPDPCSR